MSPSASTFTSIIRPVRAYHFCSDGILSVVAVNSTFGPSPSHAYICDGVTDWMADLSKGTGAKSVLAIHRFLPLKPLHSQGETKITSGAAADLANTDVTTKPANRGNR